MSIQRSSDPGPSRLRPQAVVPSCMNLCLRALRLMDLDQRHDWPGINQRTFRDANHGHRISSAEWTIFQLFEKWDSEQARTKFQGLFPSTGSLQSTKLRNAYVLALTDLKRSGCLPSELCVRKSSFDDCKGEKFEQFLFLFSQAVLRKITPRNGAHLRSRAYPSTVSEVSTAQALTEHQHNLLQPLTLAHESSLRVHIRTKLQEKMNLLEISTLLAEKENTLEQQKVDLENELVRHKQTLSMNSMDAEKYTKQVRQAFAPESKWVATILDTDMLEDKDPLPHENFEDMFTSNVPDMDKTPKPIRPRGVLADLQARVDRQRERLDVWRDFQKELSKRNELSIVAKSPVKSPVKSPAKSPSKTHFRSPTKSPVKKAGRPPPKLAFTSITPESPPRPQPRLYPVVPASSLPQIEPPTGDAIRLQGDRVPRLEEKFVVLKTNDENHHRTALTKRPSLPQKRISEKTRCEDSTDYSSVFATRTPMQTRLSWSSTKSWMGS